MKNPFQKPLPVFCDCIPVIIPPTNKDTPTDINAERNKCRLLVNDEIITAIIHSNIARVLPADDRQKLSQPLLNFVFDGGSYTNSKSLLTFFSSYVKLIGSFPIVYG